MVSVILTIMAGIGFAALAAAAIAFVCLTLKNVIERIKTKIGKDNRDIVNVDSKKLGNAIQAMADEANSMSISELEELTGKKGLIEVELDEDDKVIPESIQILKTDERDNELEELLNNNNGILKITA